VYPKANATRIDSLPLWKDDTNMHEILKCETKKKSKLKELITSTS